MEHICYWTSMRSMLKTYCSFNVIFVFKVYGLYICKKLTRASKPLFSQICTDWRFYYQIVFYIFVDSNTSLQLLTAKTHYSLQTNLEYSFFVVNTLPYMWWQPGQVVGALDLKFGGLRFKSCSLRKLVGEFFFLVSQGQDNSSVTLVNGQLVCLLPVGIFIHVLCSIIQIISKWI